MKKIFFPFLALLVLVSCEKAVFSEEDSNEPKGNFIVNVFEIEHTPFSTLTRTAPANACTRFNFAVYQQDGTRVKQVNQKLEDPDFGTASFQLAEGDYQLVVVAHSSDGNPTMTDPKKVQFSNAQGFTDTFLWSGKVTIGDEAKEMSLSLRRIVALCRFVITDDFPADVKTMRFYYTGGSGAFDAATGYGSVNSKQDVKFPVSATQKQFDLYTFLHDAEGTIKLTVTALDDKNNVLNERSFDVPLYQNQITWYSGAFFDGSGASSTTITDIDINTEWAGEHHLTF
jgi:hypothetical protein